MDKKTFFISLEGGDAVGKSTQLRLLSKELNDRFYFANPSDLSQSSKIRAILLEQDTLFEPLTEVLIHTAARKEHVEKVILPKLLSGISVICDRFLDSTIVYQGFGLGCDIEIIKKMHNLILPNIYPDFSFILDIDPKISMQRIKKRSDKSDRYESKELEFHQRIREGFLDLANENPKKYMVIDASLEKEKICESIITKIKELTKDKQKDYVI